MTIHHARLFAFTAILLIALPAVAQTPETVVRQWLQERHAALGLTVADASQWNMTSSSTDSKGVTYVYIRQEVNGLPVHGAVANFALREGSVVHFGDRLETDLAGRAPSPSPALDAATALQRAAAALELKVGQITVQEQRSPAELVLGPSDISHDPIPARLMYQPVEDGTLRLVWELTIRSLATPHWWNLAVDAVTGALIRSNDLVVHCTHPQGTYGRGYDALHDLGRPDPTPAAAASHKSDGAGYRVFPFPTESPAHGEHVLVTGPADAEASPLGWHDTEWMQYTITRGNNVYAYEDLEDIDQPGTSPDGGADLLFDFPYTPPQDPMDYLDASVTNLFYICNVLHDVFHHYGFDEESGNFQETNFTGMGEDFDPVVAEAQDGGGMNNANFATPPDGASGRMQMYLWRAPNDSALVINSPPEVEGNYTNAPAGFGPMLPAEPIIADVVLALDDEEPFTDGCTTITNAAALAGKIALVDRGGCTFVSKVLRLQEAGAAAVIVINNVPGAPFAMGGSDGTEDEIIIPSVMISQASGASIKAALEEGPVNATLSGIGPEDLHDSGFDNGIIAHEYGHGVSIRLTGGPNSVDCLWNDEQMGEGWSDYLGIVLSMRPGDTPTTLRGVGTFVRDQPNDGPGIRPAPYTTDMGVNDYTYGDTNNGNLSQPHGVGFVWATMLWDLTWALIEEYGYDENMYTGTGGNNLALQLVMDGMKLQPCFPGFEDGRDAILIADALLTDGANECLIWEVFAQRGLGYSASQGSSNNRFDQTEAFDIPSYCLSVGVDAPAGAEQALMLVPNPASGNVRLVLGSKGLSAGEVRLLGIDGRLLQTTRWEAGTPAMDLGIEGLAPAIYLVEVRMDGAVYTERLIIQ